MSLRARLVTREDRVGYDEDAVALAESLLDRAVLVAGEARFRVVELELYCYSAEHADPYAHRDPVQAGAPGRWYFHRSGASFRGGSFKGLDLTFGRPGTFGGVLLRSLRGPGELVCGPSLLVDRLLAATGTGSVQTLASRIGPRDAFDPASPLHLVEERREPRPYLRTARVGLTLKRYDPRGETASMPDYLVRPDRFLNEPAAIKKGRPEVILALHRAGETVEAIRARTNSPRRTIERLIHACGSARRGAPIAPYVGRALTPTDLAELHKILS